jgi:CHASE3 domain sensor protein
MKFGFTTFSTGKKITIYTLLVLLLLIVSVIITQKTLSKLSQTLDFITQPNLKQAKIRDILYDLSEAESAVRAYSITLENKYLDPYYHLLTTYDNDIRELKELSAGNNNHKLLIDTIGDLIGEKTLVLNGFIAIEKNQDVAEALKEIIRKIEAEEYKFQQKRIFKQEKEKVSSKEKSAETEEKINKDSLEQKVETSEQKQSIWKRIGNAFSKKEKNKDTESSQSLSGKEDEKNIPTSNP